MVFKAELVEVAMGAKLLNAERGKRYVTAVDNQAAIRTTRHKMAILAQYLVNVLHRQIQRTTEQQYGMKW